MTLAVQIIVYVAAIDGFRDRRSFKSLAGARRYAQERVGATPEFGGGYAIAADGVVKLRVSGVTLASLFPATVDADAPMTADEERALLERIMAEDAAIERARFDAAVEADRAEMRKYEPTRVAGCTCSDHQLTQVGCDCAVGYVEDVASVTVDDIANPGYGPIFAVCVRTTVGKVAREYVLTDDRALFRTEAEARRLAAKVAKVGVIHPHLWQPTSMTDAERYAHAGPGGDLWQWEETEKAAGRW